ncbi:MAG TPA: S26 family signal peptidase [Clostridiaceae bacterium]|nr:S26 family signal peptidase [Clostridiaceae bacterium]
MIYRNSYFKKELRQSYTDNKTSRSRKMAFALFSGLVSFALYFLLQTLKGSVVEDTFPEIMQPSFFSTIYIYIHMSFVLNTAYFIINYDYLFFSEIRKNSWYLLVHMNYNPAMMFFAKFFALVYSVLWTYSVGFAFVVLLTAFLRYTFVVAYIPSLYFAGIIDLFLISLITMMISLYSGTVTYARYMIFSSAAFIPALKQISGFYKILANRVTMQNVMNLFDSGRSVFVPFAVFFIILSFLACSVRARSTARYFSSQEDDMPFPEDVSLLRINLKTGRLEPAVKGRKEAGINKTLNMTVSVLLIILICALLMFNLLVILINATTPGSEVAILGAIPYIFRSETMKPEIMPNDLAYFKKVDADYDIDKGQIIIFRQDNTIFVERVIDDMEDYLVVDIDYYPSVHQTGSMRKTIKRELVIGVFTGRNRWLGALILFANTIFGRVLFLFIPAVLLFYHRQLRGLYMRSRRTRQKVSS